MGRHQTNLVYLTSEERIFLEKQTKKGSWKPREVIRAKIILEADQNGLNPLMDEEIATKLNCSKSSVSYRRKRFSDTQSVEDTIFDKPRSGRPGIVDGALDAHMTTIACTSPPEGHAQWSLRLIKDRLVALEIVDNISYSTIRRTLKKKKSNLG
jgi:transposase